MGEGRGGRRAARHGRGPGWLALAVLCGLPVMAAALAAPETDLPFDPGVCSLRLEIEGVGTVLACPPGVGMEGGEASRLYLQKPGGMVEVIHTLEGLVFTGLFRGDLDGDKVPELIAVAGNPSNEDRMPFIFSEKNRFACLYPQEEEDIPLLGQDISLATWKEAPALCLRTRIDFHRYGPPDLFQSEYFRFVGDRLRKVGETLSEGDQLNLRLNRAALAFQRGNLLEALHQYEGITAHAPPDAPLPALAEALFAQAEARTRLKDFATADNLYQRVATEFPDSPLASEARLQRNLVQLHSLASTALGLYVDARQLTEANQGEQALALLEAHRKATATGPVTDRLLLLEAEVLTSLGRTDEALPILRAVIREFPSSPVRVEAGERLEELEGGPESDEADAPSPAAGPQDR
ncbi:MAG: tetratricopeptide repeat protein [Candidatus Riflebacteria bacterium]|nr:tetratricopeptide repeat protein [Candidatus Riflebacteria bacterium]